MRRSYILALSALLVAGCSGGASQVQVRTPHEHHPVNTIRPGNAIGNSLTIPESFLGVGEDSRRASLPSSAGSPDVTDIASAAQPFSSLSDDPSASQWETAAETGPNPEQVLGLETSVVQSTESSAVDLPAAPAAVIEPSSPSWSDIVSTPAEPSLPAMPVSQLSTEQVYHEAEALPGLDRWTVIPFAHFRRGLRHVVIAWPAMNSSGEVVDATVVGICLEEDSDGALEPCGSRWVVNGRAASTAALEDALGGSDYEVVGQQASVSLDELGPQLARLGNSFASAAEQGDGTGAQWAARDFVQMLPVDEIAFDNELAQLLWAAARYNGRLEHVSTERQGASATLVFDVNRGWMRVQTIRVTARPIDGDSNLWAVVDYR